MLPASLHSFTGMYEWVLDIKEQNLGIIRKQTSFTKACFSNFVSN